MNFALRTQSLLATQPATLVVAVEPAFDFASAEYCALQQRSRATAFQAGRWLKALHRDIAPVFGMDPVTLTVRDEADGQLMLVLPLVRRRRHGVRMLEFADFGLCDYHGAVYDPGEAPLLSADASLPQRIITALPPHDVLALTKLPDIDPLLERLFPDARRARMRLSAYPAQIGPDWTPWRSAKLDHGFRRYLDMKRRRLVRSGTPEFALVREPNAIAQAFEALRHYRGERFKALGAPDVLDNEAVFAFYRRMAIEGARDGSTRTHCLYLSGEPIAVVFGLVQRRVYSLLLIGLDVARHSRLSPGLLAIEDTMRTSIEAGDRVYDFTIGDHPYKLQFGAEAVPLHEWHQARTVRGHAAVLAIALMREAKRTLRPLLRRRKNAPKESASNDA